MADAENHEARRGVRLPRAANEWQRTFREIRHGEDALKALVVTQSHAGSEGVAPDQDGSHCPHGFRTRVVLPAPRQALPLQDPCHGVPHSVRFVLGLQRQGVRTHTPEGQDSQW